MNRSSWKILQHLYIKSGSVLQTEKLIQYCSKIMHVRIRFMYLKNGNSCAKKNTPYYFMGLQRALKR